MLQHPETSDDLAMLLRGYRIQAGLTQEALAERAGVGLRSIQGIESGERRPLRGTLRRLMAALDLPAEQRRRLEALARASSPLPRGAPPDHAARARPRPEAGRDPCSSLPRSLTSFVGRQREMEAVAALLATTRLLTLTGAGGVGKTRLALEVARQLVDHYQEGAWFVDLASLSDPALVPQTVAVALSVPEDSHQSIQATLTQYLETRHVLLVLDNCEHLADACARLADQVLRKCPRVRILATSREALGIAGEVSWRVPSLQVATPDRHLTLDEIARSEAGQLFVARASAVQPGFGLTEQNAPLVAQICQRLDRMPLAIELAAARVRVLTVEQIAERLDDRFHLLTGGSRTALPRHQTLHALLDWSHELLSESERLLFRRLAVFAGGWSLGAAEVVCSGSGIDPEDVLDLLTGLVDKSLVGCDGQGGEERYRFLETIRAYAGEKLAAAGEALLLRDRHLAWCLALAERAESGYFGPSSAFWLDRLEVDYANLRTALDWCLETDSEAGLRLGGRLWWYWLMRDTVEGHRRLAAILARAPESSALRAKALLGAGFCSRDKGTRNQGRSWSEQSLALARAAGDRRLAGWALNNLGNLLMQERDDVGARAVLEESIAVCRQIGDKVGEGMSLRDLGVLAALQGDDARASRLYDESLAVLRPTGHRWNVLWTLLTSGYLARRQQAPGRARAAFRECLFGAREEGDQFFVTVVLLALGDLERSAGNYDEAAAYLREALAELRNRRLTEDPQPWLCSYATLLLKREPSARGVRLAAAAPWDIWRSGYGNLPEDRADYEAAVQAARAALGEEAFAVAWAEGQAMTLEEAVGYALEGDDG